MVLVEGSSWQCSIRFVLRSWMFGIRKVEIQCHIVNDKWQWHFIGDFTYNDHHVITIDIGQYARINWLQKTAVRWTNLWNKIQGATDYKVLQIGEKLQRADDASIPRCIHAGHVEKPASMPVDAVRETETAVDTIRCISAIMNYGKIAVGYRLCKEAEVGRL